MFVYLITNTTNGQKYVGLTTGSIRKRWNEHKCAAKYDAIRPLYRAMRKHGVEAFTIEVLATADTLDDLKRLECSFIHELRTFAPHGGGYNLTLGGDGLCNLNSPRGERRHNAKLTADAVRFIRSADVAAVSNEALVDLVHQKFGVTTSLEGLKSARNGKSWKHIDAPPVKVAKGARQAPKSEAQKAERRAQLASIHAEAIVKSAELRRGKRGKNAKLTVAQVQEIFFAEGSGISIAARYGVAKKIVYGIKKREMHPYITRSL